MNELTVSPGDLIRAEDWNALVARVPSGTIVEWPTSSVPAGWILCDGGVVPTGADALRTALGGATTVPDRRAHAATLLVRHASFHGSQTLPTDGTFQSIGSQAGFTKRSADSDVLVEWSTSAWLDGAAGSASGVGRALARIRFSGPDGTRDDGMYPYFFNKVVDHRHFGSTQRVSSMAAGAWTAQIQLALDRSSGGVSLRTDDNDAFTIVVWEIQTRNYIIKR